MVNDQKAIESGKKQDENIKLPTSSRNVIITGLILVTLFFGGVGGWTATARLQGAVIAPGEIIVESYRKQVQHLDGGIVEEILVREGDSVEKGEVLIRLDGERVQANRDLYRGQMDALQARQARLMAEKDSQKQIIWPENLLSRAHISEVKDNIKTEQIIFETRLVAKLSQKKLYNAQINQLKSQIKGQLKQLDSLEKTILSLDEEIAAKAPLLKEQYLDRSHIMELERTLNSNRARRDELETQIVLAEEKIEELFLKIEDLEAQYTREAASELGDVRQSILELRERLRPAEDACRRLEITAPEQGVVVNLNVRTEGGVIQGGAPLMEIVPQESRLIVSARVPPDKIDDVKKGQNASVALSAFPMRYTPRVLGVVTYVSADRVESRQQQMPPYYLVYVELDSESLKDAIEDASRLTPGMPAEVYIQTEERTVLSYILTPITESMSRSFRE